MGRGCKRPMQRLLPNKTAAEAGNPPGAPGGEGQPPPGAPEPQAARVTRMHCSCQLGKRSSRCSRGTPHPPTAGTGSPPGRHRGLPISLSGGDRGGCRASCKGKQNAERASGWGRGGAANHRLVACAVVPVDRTSRQRGNLHPPGTNINIGGDLLDFVP